TNCQSPFPLQRELQRIFKMDARVIVPYVGGGFGSKSRDRLECVVTAAAQLAGRPVRLVLTQEETFQTFIRPAYRGTIKTGVKADGTIVARHVRFTVDVGAYAISGARTANNTLKVATGPYRIPNALVECEAVYTNKPPSAPYRGLPTTQHTMAYEAQLDRIARDLGIDPVEIRMRNLVVDGDVHITGDLLRSTHAKECLEVAAAGIDWGTPSEPPDGPAKLRGKGVSCTIKYTLTPPTRMSENGAEVELGEDGLFEVRIGTVNIGQGSDTTMAQIAADGLGIGLERIRIVHSDTALVPFDSSTTASRSTYHMGNAVLDAAAKLTADVLTVASQLLERDAASLALGPDGVEGADGGTLSYEELVRRSGGPLTALGECVVGGTYTAPDGTEYPIASTFWSFASAAAEVEVDTDTGEVRVLRMGAASNVGKAVNPDSVRTQLEGGVGMELGPTLFEQLVWDEGGQLLTAALMDYPLPTMETSPIYRPEIVEHPLEGGPFGAKGMGEIGSVITPAAVLNAVYDATGVMFHEVPLLPHKVLEALEGSS
ncbi:MAG: molybdopterin-dependent oxidoreductase, partial [Chloroflexi bacterium]|nr:molybdopterin-dependent oxidoreductase [Chloroflexota bacterium]